VFYSKRGSDIVLRVKIQPNSSRNEFVGLYGEDALKIKISAPAVEGSANKELIKFLSKSFKVAKSSIEIISGQSSKIKLIKIPESDKLIEFIKGLEDGR
jgi:uncharacterized protein (TIGR00251 family)